MARKNRYTVSNNSPLSGGNGTVDTRGAKTANFEDTMDAVRRGYGKVFGNSQYVSNNSPLSGGSGTINTRGAKTARVPRNLGIGNSKYVSNNNPTASGNGRIPQHYQEVRTGKERANHRYVKKVKTKSGKIRYIYDDAVAGVRKVGKQGLDAAGKMGQGISKFANDTMRNIQKQDIPGQISREVGNAINAGRNFINSVMDNLRNIKLPF